MFKIGNVEVNNIVALGPMAGVTDLPFRMLCKEQGCGLLYTEMVSAKAILYNNRNTKELIQTNENESPIGLQLFGSDPSVMADMAARMEEGLYDFIDVNMGCPVPKIVGNKEGSALMRDPKLAGDIIKAMTDKCKKPVTVKIRKGFDDNMVNAVELAKRLEGMHSHVNLIPVNTVEGTGLFRKCRLGYHKRSKGSSKNSRNRKRGYKGA